jgi:hypothetical protein
MLIPNRTGQIWYIKHRADQNEYIICMIIKAPFPAHTREAQVHEAVVLDANNPLVSTTLRLYEKVDVSWEKSHLSWQRVL